MDEKAEKINEQRFETFFPQKDETKDKVPSNKKVRLEKLKRERN